MKNTRHQIFETNSSSTHSISISEETPDMYESLEVNYEKEVVLTGGTFGWEWADYNDAKTKANYAAVFVEKYSPKNKDLLISVIKEHTGAEEVVFLLGDRYDDDNYSYIDHQSIYEVRPAFENKKILKEWIFNPKSFLHTGNDND
jgi:hypothetical protein